ncbi:membrane protein insertase YidC [Blattabacterium cuenoti]|uniref:membrane protein insertase YidC n=1 Tax=Blattabacterium cuenoti TaxID=1653831 RepID=UPI00163C765C|nr:membrane protein insertase YidC [Blattabacterium cuenoti]
MKNKNLDYNYIIGLIIILCIVIFFTFFLDREFLIEKEQKGITSLYNDVNLYEKEKTIYDNKIKNNFILENKVLKFKISNLGGGIDEVFLKKYKAYNNIDSLHNKNLFLIKNSSFLYKMIFYKKKNSLKKNEFINTNFLYFYPVFFKKNILILRANNPYGKGYIEYLYSLKENEYNIRFIVRTIDFYPKNEKVSIFLEQKIFSLEKDRDWENSYTQGYVSYKKNIHNIHSKIDYLSEKKNEKKYLSNVNWIAYKQQFFASIFMMDKSFQDFYIFSENFSSGNFLKKIQSKVNLKIKKNEELNIPFQFYFGPLNFNLIKNYNRNLENIIPFGWGFLKWINKYFFLLIFQFLEKTNLNYGIIIILMTIVVKLILSPITYKQYKLNAMMKLIRPELDELNNKLKNSDPLKKQREIMKLYKKVGINPMSGCLSTIFQIPIFYSLFKFFPTLINLRGKSFLWVDDLTSYDSIYKIPFTIPFYGNHVSLLTLLYSLALLLYTKINNNNDKNNDYNKNNMPNMNFLLYLMPIMMLLFINSYASALSLYYLISNIINISLIFIIKKYILNEKKIFNIIQKNKKK